MRTADGFRLMVDARWIRRRHIGISRFAAGVVPRLGGSIIDRGPSPLHPLDPIWLALRIARANPDAYFNPGFNPPLFSKVPFAFTIHDLIPVRFSTGPSAAQRGYYRWMVRPAAARAACIFTPSAFTRREVLEWTGLPAERVVAVGAGVDPPFGPSGPSEELGRPYFLFVGTVKPHKNLVGVLDAYFASGLSAETRLVITCRRDAAGALVADRGVEDAVVFAEPSDDALAALYRGAVALVLPSFYEGFGLPVLEAMACGTPVVTSNATALEEVAGDAAILVDPDNTDEIAAALVRMRSDDGLRAELRERGLRRARDFGWERTADTIRRTLEATA